MSVVAGERKVEDTPQNRMFYAVDSARELATHTIRICSNQKIFDPRYDDIKHNIVNTAIRIYTTAWNANNVLVKTSEDWKLRKGKEQAAARGCTDLLALIGLAKKLYHLRDPKVKYWAELTIRTRKFLRAWHESDQKRYGKIE